MDIVLNPEDVIEEYYRKLCETLTTLGCGQLCPIKQHLYEQYDQRCKLGIMMGLVTRSYIFRGSSAVEDAAGKCTKEEYSRFSETFRKDAKKMLPYFFQRGWL